MLNARRFIPFPLFFANLQKGRDLVDRTAPVYHAERIAQHRITTARVKESLVVRPEPKLPFVRPQVSR